MLSKVKEAKIGLKRDDISHVKTIRPYPEFPALQFVRLTNGNWYDYNVGIPVPKDVAKDFESFVEWIDKTPTIEDKTFTMGEECIKDEEILKILNVGI